MSYSNAFTPTGEALRCSELSTEGFVIAPITAELRLAADNVTRRKKIEPAIIANIPNVKAFSEGPDFFGNGLVIKPRGSVEAFLPKELEPFLPVALIALQHDILTLGAEKARDRYVMIKPSRHTSVEGFAHQPHFPEMHNHAGLGPSTYYLASDRFGTIFPTWKAPDASIVRFEENDRHASPIMGAERRTLVIVASYDTIPDRRGELGIHRHPMRDKGLANLSSEAREHKIEQWRTAGKISLAQSYGEQQQAGNVARWRTSLTAPISLK